NLGAVCNRDAARIGLKRAFMKSVFTTRSCQLTRQATRSCCRHAATFIMRLNSESMRSGSGWDLTGADQKAKRRFSFCKRDNFFARLVARYAKNFALSLNIDLPKGAGLRPRLRK